MLKKDISKTLHLLYVGFSIKEIQNTGLTILDHILLPLYMPLRFIFKLKRMSQYKNYLKDISCAENANMPLIIFSDSVLFFVV